MRPALEGLEKRELLYATTGALWSQPQRVTFSFAPDGTSVGGTPSAWFQTMAARGISQTTWQNQFRTAAAIWEAVTNINLVEVTDNGTALSASGNQESDPRFGDIRIAGIPQSSNVLGLCFYPPPYNGGTLAGDIVMNSSQAWNVNSTYDILTVAVHEMGHALGMDHSTIAQADMYASYTSTHQGLNADDVSGIQTVYGPRHSDAAEGNNTAGTATNITPYINSQSQIILAGLDITTNSDYDWYSVTVPSATNGTMVVAMQSTGLSLLSPKLLLYNSALSGLAQVAAPNAFGQTVSVTLSGVKPGQVYYFKAMAANTGPTGAGGYGLEVNFGSNAMSAIAPPNTKVAQQPSKSAGANAPQETGGGGGGGGLLGGLVGGLVGIVFNLLDHVLTIGDLSGIGDYQTVGPASRHHEASHRGGDAHAGHMSTGDIHGKPRFGFGPADHAALSKGHTTAFRIVRHRA
jgi:predicted Zn-dependent protease